MYASTDQVNKYEIRHLVALDSVESFGSVVGTEFLSLFGLVSAEVFFFT